MRSGPEDENGTLCSDLCGWIISPFPYPGNHFNPLMEGAKMKGDPSDRNKRISREEFEEKKIELECFPQMLALYTTDACNLRCIGCQFGKRTASKLSINEEGYRRAFEVFPFVKEIGIAGAEMFFDAGNPKGYVQKIFDEARKYPDLKFLGFTNGTLLTSERIELIVDKFNWVGISIDSPYPDVYKTIRVGGNLNKVIGNIEKISELKAQRGLGRTDHPKIVLSSVIIEPTYQCLLDLVRLAGDVGAARIHLLEPWVGTYEKENIFHDRDKTLEYLVIRKEAVEEARKLNIKVQDRTRNVILNNFPSFRKYLEASENEQVGKWPDCCDAPWNELYIWRNGEARICCTSKTIIGNINRDSISEMWNSPLALELRQRILKGHYEKDCQENCHRGYALPHCKRRGLLAQVTSLFQRR
jgi:MoaA/NifB/PqqE/SkfB family radical SAM enzyme